MVLDAGVGVVGGSVCDGRRLRALEALELRRAGVGLGEIAVRLGYKNSEGVRQAVRRQVDRVLREEVEVGRVLHGARLDSLLASCWVDAQRPLTGGEGDANVKWCRRFVLDVLDRMAKFDGFNKERASVGGSANVLVVAGDSESYVDSMKQLAAQQEGNVIDVPPT